MGGIRARKGEGGMLVNPSYMDVSYFHDGTFDGSPLKENDDDDDASNDQLNMGIPPICLRWWTM